METVGIGVIGVGTMGSIHASTYAGLPMARLVGVTDRDAARAREVAKGLGVRAFGSTAELLRDPAIEAVSICTSDPEHVEPTLAAFDAGKHVLLEKPIATSMGDAETILQAHRRAISSGGGARCFLVGHILRFEQRYAEARRRVAQGEIGEVVSVYARRLNAASAQRVLQGRVSVISFLGVHDLDICRWIVGRPAERVYCESRRGHLASQGYDVEDQAFVLVAFSGGAIACVECGWVLPDAHPRRADFSMEIVGTRGVVNIELMSQGISMCTESGLTYPRLGLGIDRELDHFLRCVRGMEKPGITGEEAREALALCLAAQESSGTHQPVTIRG